MTQAQPTDPLVLNYASFFVAGKKYNIINLTNTESAVMTGGLVQEFHHTILPSISPLVTLVLTVLSILVSLFLELHK